MGREKQQPSNAESNHRSTNEALRQIDPQGKAAALVDFIRQTAAVVYLDGDFSNADMPLSSDPQSGTIDLRALRAALDQAGDGLAWQVCALFRQRGEPVDNTLTLIEAAAGWNRPAVENLLRRHKQIAIKAYGLLPLTRGPDEVLERYLALRQEATEETGYSRRRRAQLHAAVQAALVNLAQVAGYGSALQLEWAMEALIMADRGPLGRRWTVGDYTLDLVMAGEQARIAVERSGKPLKSAPAAVRATDAYEDAKTAVMGLRNQIRRLRSGLLEGLIASGEALPPSELRHLLALPAACAMFQRLIWRTESGLIGLFDADAFALRDLSGALHPVKTPIALAHVNDLFESGTLADWQRAIVHAHIVQPIKQAFRELYILTPAELDTETYSNRFAAHQVDSAVTAALLNTRGWRLEYDDVRQIAGKRFGDLRATFEFADSARYRVSSRPIMTGRIAFLRRYQQSDETLPLDQVLPVIFSEVMRDADLVVSVAQRDGETTLSPESYEQRGSLVRALLDDLGLPGVEVEGHFAHVQGKLARYRVHLGSAAIHIEPGNYLCVVPDRVAPKRESFYLPFADGDDPKFSEVVSKILLLLADARITDESILRQIRRQTG